MNSFSGTKLGSVTVHLEQSSTLRNAFLLHLYFINTNIFIIIIIIFIIIIIIIIFIIIIIIITIMMMMMNNLYTGAWIQLKNINLY